MSFKNWANQVRGLLLGYGFTIVKNSELVEFFRDGLSPSDAAQAIMMGRFFDEL